MGAVAALIGSADLNEEQIRELEDILRRSREERL